MKISTGDKKFLMTAMAFGFAGLVLLGGCIAFSGHINEVISDGAVVADVTKDPQLTTAGIESENTLQPLPVSIIQEITRDERNIVGSPTIDKPLSPALKFLRTISDKDIFLTQK